MAVPLKATFNGNLAGVGVAAAVAASGSQTALTVTVTFDEAVFPGTELSVTVRVALHEHAELKVCFGFWIVLSADPSPKFLL